MILELVKCPHCGYKYRTDMKKIVKDGETVAVRLGFPDIPEILQKRTAKSLSIDLTCPNCKKEFEWEVRK